MRGTVAIQVVVPTAGLVRNVPVHEAPPNSLVDGLNVYVDEDGLLKTRQGYTPVGTLSPIERVTGIVGYRDISGIFQEVVGTPLRWQRYNGDGTFTDISGSNPLHGDADNPVRFTPFAQNSQVWVYGVNNHDGLIYWNSSLAAYVPIVGGGPFIITSITEPSGTTATVTLPTQVLGIKIGDTVVISGNSVPSFNGSFAVTGVGLNSFTYVTGSSGLGTGTGGTAVDAQGGAPFAAARDITVLANRVVVVNTAEGGANFSSRVRWSAFNDGTTWPALGLNDLLDSNDAIVGVQRTSRVSAIIYRDLSAWLLSAYPGDDSSAFTAERISVVDNMTGPCGPAAIVIAEGYHYYMGQDGRVYRYDGNTIAPISDPIDPVVRPLLNTQTSDRTVATYLPTKRSILFFFPASPNAEPQRAVMYNIRRQAFEPLMTFADALTAAAVVQETNSLTWNNWVPASTTWSNIQFSSWDSIPQSQSLNCWAGTTTGAVHRFFSAPNDNGVVIPYYAVYPPLRQDPNKMQRAQYIELYLQQAISPETLTALLVGLLQPYTTPSTAIVAMAVQQSDQTTFQMPIQPGPFNSRNTPANFLQLTIESAGALAQLVFSGGTIFVDLDDRGDYGQQ